MTESDGRLPRYDDLPEAGQGGRSGWGLFGRLPEAAAASYLSGLLIGHEARAAAPASPVLLIGDRALCELYGQAITLCGGSATLAEADAAAQGLALIGEQAAWTSPAS